MMIFLSQNSSNWLYKWYGLKTKCPSFCFPQGSGLVPSFYSILEYFRHFRRWDLDGESIPLKVSCPYSLSASHMPCAYHEVVTSPYVLYPTFHGAWPPPQAHSSGISNHILKPLNPWAKINLSSLKSFFSTIYHSDDKTKSYIGSMSLENKECGQVVLADKSNFEKGKVYSDQCSTWQERHGGKSLQQWATLHPQPGSCRLVALFHSIQISDKPMGWHHPYSALVSFNPI